MKFGALWAFAVILIHSHVSLGVPLLRRVTPTIKVLASPAPPAGEAAPPPGNDNLCSQEQVNAIKAGMAEALVLAQAAADKLHVAGAEQSEGVTTWLGAFTEENPFGPEVTRRFTNPAATFALSGQLEGVSATTAGDDSLYFQCPTTCTAGSNAVTENKGFKNTPFNTISLCDPFFATGTGLAQDKGAYFAVPTSRRKPLRNDFPAPKAKGSILLHEAQHSLPLLQSTNQNDNLLDTFITPASISNPIRSASEKQSNAESWALVGFLAAVDPGRFSPPSGCNARRGLGETGVACALPPLNSTISTTSASHTSSASSASHTSSVVLSSASPSSRPASSSVRATSAISISRTKPTTKPTPTAKPKSKPKGKGI